MDTELRRRYDLIPNLVATVKGYAAHERDTLEAVIRARGQAVAATGAPEEQAPAENLLVDGLKQLFAVAEAYPDLRADGTSSSCSGSWRPPRTASRPPVASSTATSAT